MNMNSPTDNDDHRNGVVGAIDDADATALDADEVTGSEHEDSEDDDDEGTRMKTPVAKRANDDPPLTLKSKYRQFEYLRVRQGDDGKNGRMLCKGCITSCKEDFLDPSTYSRHKKNCSCYGAAEQMQKNNPACFSELMGTYKKVKNPHFMD
jgi:hypothetical protein